VAMTEQKKFIVLPFMVKIQSLILIGMSGNVFVQGIVFESENFFHGENLRSMIG
jgi:hypothetical protein